MKRYTFIIGALLVCLSCFAQSGHMKFMGIPLNGTINSFQSKLAAKGVKTSTAMNSHLPVGTRKFNGVFAGHNADIFVYYEKNTKTVYRAKACINDEFRNLAEQTYNNLKLQLEEKYSNSSITTEISEGHEMIRIITNLGEIDLYYEVIPINYHTTYSVHVDYIDYTNYQKYYNSIIDDL